MDPNSSKNKLVEPKHELLDCEFPYQTLKSTDHVGSSSPSNLRSFFIEMGYSPSLVDKVIKENGEDKVDLLLEVLMESCSGLQKPKSHSSSSLDSLFDDMGASSSSDYSTVAEVKGEPDVSDAINDNKRASLLKMNFSEKEVEFAMDKLGETASISELVDFIFAIQIAKNVNSETDDIAIVDVEVKKDVSDETICGTMDKKRHLLAMGFSENEVSLAIDKFGLEVPITELADSICVHQLGGNYIIKKKYSEAHAADPRSFGLEPENDRRHGPRGAVKLEPEDFSLDAILQSRNISTDETCKGKRPRQEYGNETRKGQRRRQEHIECYREAQLRNVGLKENYTVELPKQECYDGFGPECAKEKFKPNNNTFGMQKPFKSNPSKVLAQISKPPYFFYGNVVTASSDTWKKVSRFLYEIKPEFVDTRFFSALSRTEGYIHNLPTEKRFHILPKSPTTMQDPMPNATKWWPSWDTRKKLSCISPETIGPFQLCDVLGRKLDDSHGVLSSEQQRDLLHHCQTSNLMWVGPNKLAPIEPIHLEKILGYPPNHTMIADICLAERLHSLKYSFQTDTLGYHLSVLKSMFPQGITVLTLFSGIGGAEVALHRLGIHLKGVVSVETSETSRRILKRWWYSSGQTGQLEQIEDIQRLTSKTVERLVDKFGCFDIVICQNSCTQSPRTGSAGENQDHPVFDFTLFSEFVSVLQRVRSVKERKR